MCTLGFAAEAGSRPCPRESKPDTLVGSIVAKVPSYRTSWNSSEVGTPDFPQPYSMAQGLGPRKSSGQVRSSCFTTLQVISEPSSVKATMEAITGRRCLRRSAMTHLEPTCRFNQAAGRRMRSHGGHLKQSHLLYVHAQ